MLCSLGFSWFCLFCKCFYITKNKGELNNLRNKYKGNLDALKKSGKYNKNIENNLI